MDLKLELKKYGKENPDNYILFVHGICHAAWCFDELGEEIYKKSSIFSYSFSLRSHGNSKKYDKPIVFNDYIEDLKNILNYLYEKHKKYPILVGHSMGTLIIQDYISNNNDDIPMVVLLTPMTTIFSSIKYIYNTIPKKLVLFSLLMSFGLNVNHYFEDFTFLKNTFFSENISNDKLEKYSKLLEIEPISPFRLHYEPNIKDKKYKFPILFISTENDKLFNANYVKYIYNHYTYLGNNCFYNNIDKSGHDVILERPLELADIISRFIIKKT